MTRHFILATAGHVDHGKSSLVKALTGTDPDRLPEEKARGITIDLGFAHLVLPAADTQGDTLDLGIVDVPGHEDFVRNMVAGIGSVDLALFVVAADDGWMPQTEEHLQILTYLGVKRAVVALTKIDLAQASEQRVLDAVRLSLSDSPFSQAPIVPVSTVTGHGLEKLKLELARSLVGLPEPADIGKPRLWVDRVFSLRGIGTVVTGTLSGGRLSRGQAVVVQPAGTHSQVRTLQSHNRELDSAGPGMRVALNLADLAVATRGAHAASGRAVGRGDVITLAGFDSADQLCDVWLQRTPRLAGRSAAAARPLKDGTRVRFHIGTGDFAGRLSLADRKELSAGEECVAQIRLETGLFAFAGDRFVIRDWAEQTTLAGGIVLDPNPHRSAFRGPAHQARLSQQAVAPEDVSLTLEAQLQRDRALARNSMLAKSRFAFVDVENCLSRLCSENRAVLLTEWVAQASAWTALLRNASDLVDAHHRAHPEQNGLALSELRSALADELPKPELFDELVKGLCGQGFRRAGTVLHRTSHHPALPPTLEPVWRRLQAALAAKPLDPPSRKELIKDKASLQVLQFQIAAGQVVELGGEIVVLAEPFERAANLIRGVLQRQGSGTVSELRQALGSSRRVVVPLLERLDAQGVTRRDGDRRRLAGSG